MHEAASRGQHSFTMHPRSQTATIWMKYGKLDLNDAHLLAPQIHVSE